MKISIGSDHAGYAYKEAIVEMLSKKGVQVINHGTDSPNSVDYPDFIHPVAQDVVSNTVDFGIIICGSGNGVAMTANKHQAVRAALSWKIEIARLARAHNNANIIAIPARFVSLTMAKRMVNAFLETEFEGGRHQRRVNKIHIR